MTGEEDEGAEATFTTSYMLVKHCNNEMSLALKHMDSHHGALSIITLQKQFLKGLKGK
jgi:hypothetical protein